MQSKNKRKPTDIERQRIERIASLPCVVCDSPGPVEVHEPEQGLWGIAIGLCPECHRSRHGWHGDRLRWTLRKMTELKAINKMQLMLLEAER